MKNNDVFHSGVKHRLCKCSDYHICTPQGNVLSFRINNFISQDADPDHLLEVKVQEIQKDDPEKHVDNGRTFTNMLYYFSAKSGLFITI